MVSNPTPAKTQARRGGSHVPIWVDSTIEEVNVVYVKPGSSACAAKIKRAVTSIPTADLLATLGVIATIVTVAASLAGTEVKPETTPLIWLILRIAIVVGTVFLVLLIVRTRLEYRRRTFDPTLILQFQATWDGMEQVREEAAKACEKYLSFPEESRDWQRIEKTDREMVEPVLDFFEDLGFYLKGDQFSDEVVYHHFYHWIRGWYSNLESYVEYYRHKKKEMAAYTCIQDLYELTSRLERKSPQATVFLKSDAEKRAFLAEECGESGDGK
jgi:hypothetical protein